MKNGEKIFVVWCEQEEKILLVTGSEAKAEACALEHEVGAAGTHWAYVMESIFTE
jgi:hypothetical protein